jgi:hypothetical protein
MESKVGAGSLQQPIVPSSVQQPSPGSNVLQGSSQLDSLKQSSQQLGSQQPTQLGSYPLSSQQLGSQQQLAQLGSYPQSSQQLVPYQQPSLSSNIALQQPSQLGPLQPAYQLGSKMTPLSTQQLIKSDRGSMLTLSDDNWMVKQIQATHAPDGRQVDIRSLLYVVEDILNRATLNPDVVIKAV